MQVHASKWWNNMARYLKFYQINLVFINETEVLTNGLKDIKNYMQHIVNITVNTGLNLLISECLPSVYSISANLFIRTLILSCYF